MISQSLTIDDFGKELLLKGDSHQVMMEWEKPYMEAIIDEIRPSGDALEIGFGCGYSATRIQKYSPRSHTIIECDPDVAARAKIWAKNYKDITIIENRWQNSLHTVGLYDFIFFDDYPTEILERSHENFLRNLAQDGRFYMFIDICLDMHMNSNAILSAYVNSSSSLFDDQRWSQVIVDNPRWEYTEKLIDVDVPKNCNYFSGDKALIPILRKKS